VIDGVEVGSARRRRARSPRGRRLSVSLSPRTIGTSIVALAIIAAASFGIGRAVERADHQDLEAPEISFKKPRAPIAPPAPPPPVKIEERARDPDPPAPVLAERPTEPEPQPSPEPAPAVVPTVEPEKSKIDLRRSAPSGSYGLQLGAYQSEPEAMAFIETNGEHLSGRPVYLISTTIPERGTWHRVRVGAFKHRQDAETLKKSLPAELVEGSIVVAYK
jgi:cell division septation protein DedD